MPAKRHPLKGHIFDVATRITFVAPGGASWQATLPAGWTMTSDEVVVQ